MAITTPEVVQQLSYAAHESVLNKRDPKILDRRGMPWLDFILKRAKVHPFVREKVIVKLKQGGGLSLDWWDGAPDTELQFQTQRIDMELEFDAYRAHMGWMVPHDELEANGYYIEINGPRNKNFAKKMSEAEADILIDIFEEQMEEFMDAWDREMDVALLRDGAYATGAAVGLAGYMTVDPTAGTIGGKSRLLNERLRHHVRTGSTTGSGGTLLTDVEYLIRESQRYSRGSKARLSYWMAGSAWIDGYKAYLRANGLEYTAKPSGVGKLDMFIPDDAMYIGGLPVVHNPTLDYLDTIETRSPTWSKTCFGIAGETWHLLHPKNRLKNFSAPLDEPTRRRSRFSLDGRIGLVCDNPQFNVMNAVA